MLERIQERISEFVFWIRAKFRVGNWSAIGGEHGGSGRFEGSILETDE